MSLVAVRSGLLEPLREFVKYDYGCFLFPPPLPHDACFGEEIVLVREWEGGPDRNKLMIICELFGVEKSTPQTHMGDMRGADLAC